MTVTLQSGQFPLNFHFGSASEGETIVPMIDSHTTKLIEELADGRTDLVFDLLERNCAADYQDGNGLSLIQHCAYFGDVSAIRLLLAHGASLHSLGDNFDLNAAAFHGHWRLCQFLLEAGGNVNQALSETGETPLHAALCNTHRVVYDRVLKVLLSHGANPNAVTKPGVETEGFMRDVRTRGETPLHRAAAFGEEETIDLLLNAGATIDAKDNNGDTPLSWASWHLRPVSILRKLCHGNFHIHPQHRSMQANLLGDPQKKTGSSFPLKSP